jgi:membrane protease YdiL (CAAX protease family)
VTRFVLLVGRLARDGLLFFSSFGISILCLYHFLSSSRSFRSRKTQTIFANINFSTIAMCLTLFGRRTAPPPELRPAAYRDQPFVATKSMVAFSVAFLLAGVTGFCEESVFRRIVPSVMAQWFAVGGTGGLPVAVLTGQAVLFALGHVQPGSTSSRGENAVMVALQLVNGLGFGLLYLLTDLPTCMICHAVYDTYEFYNTWATANDQIEYADRQYQQEWDDTTQRKTRAMLSRLSSSASSSSTRIETPQMLNRLKRLFFTFDTDRNATLSRSEVRRGLAYLAVEQARRPPPEQLIDQAFDLVDEDRNDRVDFAEFVNLYYRSSGGGGGGGGGSGATIPVVRSTT